MLIPQCIARVKVNYAGIILQGVVSSWSQLTVLQCSIPNSHSWDSGYKDSWCQCHPRWREGSLVPRPPPFFVLWFVFSIIHGSERVRKTGKAWSHPSRLLECIRYIFEYRLLPWRPLTWWMLDRKSEGLPTKGHEDACCPYQQATRFTLETWWAPDLL